MDKIQKRAPISDYGAVEFRPINKSKPRRRRLKKIPLAVLKIA